MPFTVRPGPAPAVTALVRSGIDFTLHPYDPDEIDDDLELPDLLDAEDGRVLDTVVVDAGGRLAACVVPYGAEIDERKAAAALGAPGARLALETVAERATGQAMEATSPVGHRRRLEVVLDRSVASLGGPVTVFVASGQPGLEIELSVSDLLRATGGRSADLVAT